MISHAARPVPSIRFLLPLGLIALLALTALAVTPVAAATPKPAVLTLKTVKVGAPGNPAAAIVPFTNAIYKSCAEAPMAESPRAPKCMEVGEVDYRFGIGQLEVTVAQYVAFLNTVDPRGTNKQSSTARPRARLPGRASARSISQPA